MKEIFGKIFSQIKIIFKLIYCFIFKKPFISQKEIDNNLYFWSLFKICEIAKEIYTNYYVISKMNKYDLLLNLEVNERLCHFIEKFVEGTEVSDEVYMIRNKYYDLVKKIINKNENIKINIKDYNNDIFDIISANYKLAEWIEETLEKNGIIFEEVEKWLQGVKDINQMLTKKTS